jgi:hypothetical protein
MSDNKLKVGDRIYRSHYGEVCFFGVIDRVTATQAVSGNYKFKSEHHNGMLREIGRDKSSVYYHLETEFLKQKAERLEINRKAYQSLEFLRGVANVAKLTPEQAAEIINLAEKIKKEHGL